MNTKGLALVACAAAVLVSGALGGCGGATAPLVGDSGAASGSGSSSGGVSSSSGGVSSSSGGVSSSSSSTSSGGFSSSSTSGSGSGSGGFGSSSGSGSGSSSGGFGSSSGGSSGSSTAGYGNVTFEQCTGSSTLCGGSSIFEFYGQFAQGQDNQGCAVTTSGACSYYACPNATAPIGISAGTLDLYGGSLATGVTVSPDPSNPGQYTYSAGGALFTVGQVLTITASGANVPAFGPLSVVAPGVSTLTSPVATGGEYAIATSANVDVAWTGGQAPAQMILEGSGNDGGASSYFLCQWDATVGNGIVPAEMLTGFAGQTGFLVYGQLTTTNFEDDGYPISLAALQYSGGTASYQ